MNTIKLVLGFIFSVLLLSACGSDDVCNDNNSGLFIDIKCFTLSTTTIDPYINDGEFTATWEFNSDDTILNDVHFYVSEDKDFDGDAVDPEIYYDENADSTRTVTCTFGTDNVMRCGSFLVIPKDLTDFLASSPSNNYILARACTITNSCDTESILVKFQ